MKQPLVKAYVLHRRRFGDSSFLLELFTPSDGRIAVVARGAASSRSARKGLLQPFVPLLANWSGRGEVKTLCQLESRAVPMGLKGRSLYCGLYVNELIMRLTQRNDASSGLFRLYVHTLSLLASEKDLEPLLRRFEMELLMQLGYALDLTREASTGIEIKPGEYYAYQSEVGMVPSTRDRSSSIRGDTLLALTDSDSKLDQRQRAEAKIMMRQVLRFYLGDKPLKSRELFQMK